MKLNLKSSFALLTGVALLYSSCTKTEIKKPAATTAVPNEVVSSDVAINVAKSLAGSFGGAGSKDGISASAAATSSSSSNKLNSTNTLCGFFINDNVNYTTTAHDTVSVSKGKLEYFFNCTNGKATAYTVTSDLTTVGSATGFNFVYVINQNYVVKGLNENNSRIDLSGPMKSWADVKYADSTKNNYVHGNYVFKDAEINQDDNFDVTSGTASFVIEGKNSYGTYGFTGLITFLGYHRAKVEFIGKVFYVNTITGEVTAG